MTECSTVRREATLVGIAGRHSGSTATQPRASPLVFAPPLTPVAVQAQASAAPSSAAGCPPALPAASGAGGRGCGACAPDAGRAILEGRAPGAGAGGGSGGGALPSDPPISGAGLGPLAPCSWK